MTNKQPLSETINEIAQEIRKLEAEIGADRSAYARHALASVRAETQAQRDQAKIAAAESNGRVQDNRVTIEGLKIALQQAQAELQGQHKVRAREKVREALQQGGLELKMRTEAAERAQALLRQAAAAIFDVVNLGRSAHGTFRRFLSADQSYAVYPNEAPIAHAVVGELLRAGAIRTGELEELSAMGLSSLYAHEPLTAMVEHQNMVMGSRFESIALALGSAPVPDDPVPARKSRKPATGAKE